jgi:hypothetical protein
MTDSEIDVITYDIWSDIDLSNHRGDKDARETISGLESRILKGAAEAARVWYRSDCGGCGEFCEGHPETENDYSRKCSHLAGLSKAILGTASKGEANGI